MKVPVEAYVGSGWDQLLALMTLLGLLATAVSVTVITWLRLRLRKYFATKDEYLSELTRREDQHKQNAARLLQVEQQMSGLATIHSLKHVEQRLLNMQLNQEKLFQSLAEVGGQLGGLKQSGDNVERLMGLVLNHMLQRDPQ